MILFSHILIFKVLKQVIHNEFYAHFNISLAYLIYENMPRYKLFIYTLQNMYTIDQCLSISEKYSIIIRETYVVDLSKFTV